MKKYRIEKVLLIAVFVLLYSAVSIAAPPDGNQGGPSPDNQRKVENIEDKSFREATIPPQGGVTPTGGYVIENAAPSLEIPRQILSDPIKEIDKTTYQEASSIVRSNINVLNNQIKFYSDYKDVVNEKMNKALQGAGSIQDDKINRVRELAKLIPQETKKEKNLVADDSVSTLAKNGDYYKALEKLYATYESKESQLVEIEKNINIWQQIDSLIE